MGTVPTVPSIIYIEHYLGVKKCQGYFICSPKGSSLIHDDHTKVMIELQVDILRLDVRIFSPT